MPDDQGYLLPSERRILLRRYAPVLVLFPELPQQAPYPDDGDAIYTMRGSYHPRAVEFFLEHAKVRYVRLRHPGRLLHPRSVRDELRRAEESISAEDVEEALTALGPDYWTDPHYTGLDEDGVRAVVRDHLIQERLRRRVRGFDLPGYRGHNIDHWKCYFRYLEAADPQTRRSVVYGRLVQGQRPLTGSLAATEALLKSPSVTGPYDVSRTRVALQYWFHYYYDDWANRHEGDWEEITLLIELPMATIRKPRELGEKELLEGAAGLDAGYASHEDGYRRRWPDVQQTRDHRPIVYASRGASASYFAWSREGYPASARIGLVERLASLPGRISGGRRVFGRRWDAVYAARFVGRDPKNTDWTAADPLPEDRCDPACTDPLEVILPPRCRGVRRRPDFTPEAGLDDETYHLETEDLFWLEMVQEYGIQWGEDSLLPGGKGPSGWTKTERRQDRRDIQQLARLEVAIGRALHALSGVQMSAEHAIPELGQVLRPLRPRHLRKAESFPSAAHSYVYTMWAWLLKQHPEAWPGGPGVRLGLIFRQILYPGFLKFIFKNPEPEPLLVKHDPMYYLKAALAEVRRTRYERQHEGSKWDNPFAWVRHVCHADTFYYGRSPAQAMPLEELLTQLDCVDTEMTME
jgi:hypothetical protein